MIHGVTGRRWIMAEGLATRSSRGHRTLCLPIAEEAYPQVVHDPVAFRRWIDDRFRETPELFPANFARGYELKDGRTSARQGLPIRRLLTRDDVAYSVRPSFLSPLGRLCRLGPLMRFCRKRMDMVQ